MTLDFIITGFPRSRMAWIANYLTYDNIECQFDAFARGLKGDGPDVVQHLTRSQGIIGIADSAALMFQDRLIRNNPNAKWIIVERSQRDVMNSFKRLGVPIDNRLTHVHGKMGELKLKVDAMIVPFDSLNESIIDIAERIDPNWFCPRSRHEMLIGLNVQSTLTNEDLSRIPSVNPLSEEAEPATPTETQENYFRLLRQICGDNQNAYRWLYQAIQCASIIDHIMDVELIDYQLFESTMKGVLLEWGLNEFFLKNSRYLLPTMSAAMSAWQHATGDMKRVKHYDIYTELPCAIAFIRGGQSLVDQFSPRLRMLVEQLMLEDDKRDEHS